MAEQMNADKQKEMRDCAIKDIAENREQESKYGESDVTPRDLTNLH